MDVRDENNSQDGAWDPAALPFYWLLPICLSGTVVTTGIWNVVYIAIRRFTTLENSLVHRVMAVSHSIIAVTSAWKFGYAMKNVFNSPTGNTWFQTLAVLVSNGYFIHDTLYWSYEGFDDIVMLLHHITTVLSFIYSLTMGRYATFLSVFIWTFEAATVNLNVRYLMRSYRLQRKSPFLYQLNEIIFVISFVLERFVVGMHFSYLLLMDSRVVTFFMKITCIALNIISCIFYYGVYKMFRRRYGNRVAFEESMSLIRSFHRYFQR